MSASAFEFDIVSCSLLQGELFSSRPEPRVTAAEAAAKVSTYMHYTTEVLTIVGYLLNFALMLIFVCPSSAPMNMRLRLTRTIPTL